MRDPKRLPPIEPTLQCTSRCLSEGRAISQVLPPGFAFRPSFRERPHGSYASPRSPALSFESAGFFGRDVVDRLLQLRHARGHNPIESSGLAPIASLVEREPEHTFVKTTHATQSRSAPSRSRMTGPACPSYSVEGMRVHDAFGALLWRSKVHTPGEDEWRSMLVCASIRRSTFVQRFPAETTRTTRAE